MELADFLSLDDVSISLKVDCKKQLLSDLAKKAANKTGLDEHVIFEKLLERERLGSTGVGNAIGIPHGKIEGLDEMIGFFARLQKPVDFDASDDEQVDMVFLLLAPESAGADHLKTLSKIARLLREPGFVANLRGASSKEAVYSLLVEDLNSNAA